MAIDKSIRQYYQDGEDVGPFERGRKIISPEKTKLVDKLVSTQRPDWKKAIVDTLIGNYLGKRIPGGRKTVERGLNLATGKEKLRDIFSPKTLMSGLTQGSPLSRAKSAAKGYRALDLGQKILSGTGKGIMSAAPLLGAGAGIAYLHRNRERFTGYPTQIAYEQNRQKNINIDRIDMRSDPKTLENLEINLKREGLSDKEIKDRINQFKGETTRMKADVVGADIFNPNEMKNLDETYENVKYNIDPNYEKPSLTGDVTSDSVVNVDAVKAAIEKSKAEQKQIEEIQKRADEAAIPDVITLPTKETAPVIKPKVIAVSAPSPYREPSGGQQHGGGGGGAAAQARGDVGGGSWRDSPFKYGGPVYVYKRNNSIDKALKGRKRDI